MHENSTPLHLAPPDQAEERARADLYGVLTRLWIGAPDSELMQQLSSAAAAPAEPGSPLLGAWNALVTTMRDASPQAMADEYAALFQGVGRPEVFLYGSFYLAGFLNERPLARLRHDLGELGLARDTASNETEDHVAFLCEVMRYLIAGDDAAVCNLERQRRFFRSHLQPWVEQMCDAVEAHPGARTWRAVAGLTRAFMQVEAQAFDMLDT